MRIVSCGSLLVLVASLSAALRADDAKAEPGFTLLFNGKNLDGWKTKTGNKSLDGQTEAYKGRFKVANGILVIDPTVKGDVIINTARDFGKDVHLKFDFKPGKACNNDLFFRGIKFDIVLKLKGLKMDEWNDFEIICKDNKAEYKINGVTQRMATAKGSAPFGIRAEFGNIEFRNIRFKE